MPVLVHHPPTETPPRRCSLSVPRPRRCQVQVWHAATGEGSAESLLSLSRGTKAPAPIQTGVRLAAVRHCHHPPVRSRQLPRRRLASATRGIPQLSYVSLDCLVFCGQGRKSVFRLLILCGYASPRFRWGVIAQG